MSAVLPVLLCGGSGTRLWPLSREAYPKQFLPLAGKQSLLQATCLRLQGLPGASAPLLISNEEHRFMVAEQCRQIAIDPQAIILEPMGRNTAPAIAVAALYAVESQQDPILLVLPSDHLLRDEAGFRTAILAALPAAEAGGLLTFGIVPTTPETGFGYIKAAPGDGVRAVAQFVEKPDQATAEKYLASGEYFWNSGMFMFRASRFIEELEKFAPEILLHCKAAIADAKSDVDFLRLDKATFAACPADSIDYAVMEKTRHAMVLPIDVGWSDVGSWSALWQVAEQDAQGNVHRGDVMAENCRNTFV